MATLYVGSKAEKYYYNSISSAVSAAASGDTIILRPGTWSAYNIATSKTLTIKGDVGVGFAHDSTNPASWPVYIYYSDSTDYFCFKPNGGTSSSQNLTFESLRIYQYDTNGYHRGIVSMENAGPYCNVVVNKCYFYGYPIWYSYDGMVEIRNSWKNANYWVWATQTDGKVNVIKCAANNSNVVKDPSTGWQPNFVDYVTTPTEGYGPEYGEELVDLTLYPKIEGVLREGGQPIQREMLLMRGGIILEKGSSGADGKYSFDCKHLLGETLTLVALDSSGLLGEKSIVIDKITPGDPRR